MTLEASLGTVLNGLGDAYTLYLPKTGATYPALVYQMINENYIPLLDGSGIDEIETLYQVTIWHTSITSARALARTIQSTYSGYVGNFSGTTVCNIRVTIVDEDEDKDEGLKSVALEMRFFQ